MTKMTVTSKKSVAEAVKTVVNELSPFESIERIRIVQASLTLLGESASSATMPSGQSGKEEPHEGSNLLPLRARTWLKQNGISLEQINQVFHVDGEKVEVIAAEIPGRSNRDKVRNAYILVGLSRLGDG